MKKQITLRVDAHEYEASIVTENRTETFRVSPEIMHGAAQLFDEAYGLNFKEQELDPNKFDEMHDDLEKQLYELFTKIFAARLSELVEDAVVSDTGFHFFDGIGFSSTNRPRATQADLTIFFKAA